MIESKGWDWNIVRGSHADFYHKAAPETYYLLNRWKELGLTRFLDLGCGLGRHAVMFGEKGFDVSCFDISTVAIEKTREWAEELGLDFDYNVGDMLELPYADDSFDSMLCYHVVGHTDTAGMQKVASEIWRVLRAGGECYLNMPSKNTWGWKDTDWPLVDENTKLRQEEGPENNVPHFYADYDLVKKIFGGFEFEDIHQYGMYKEDKATGTVRESWHYHLLIRKPGFKN